MSAFVARPDRLAYHAPGSVCADDELRDDSLAPAIFVLHLNLDAVFATVEGRHPAADEERASRYVLDDLPQHLLQHVLRRLLAELGRYPLIREPQNPGETRDLGPEQRGAECDVL